MEKEYEFCLRCHRKLKNEAARKIGYGPVCFEKVKMDESAKRLFNTPSRTDNKCVV